MSSSKRDFDDANDSNTPENPGCKKIIRLRNPQAMMTPDNFQTFNETFVISNKEHETNVQTKSIIPVKKHIGFNDLLYIYRKYFHNDVQASVICLANILNSTAMVIKEFELHEENLMKIDLDCIRESMVRLRNEMRERCDSILHTSCCKYFRKAIFKLDNSDLERGLQMIIVAIFLILRNAFKLKFKSGSIFKNYIKIVRTSLERHRCKYPDAFKILESNSFHPECINMINLIEETRGAAEKLSLFFKTSNNVDLELFTDFNILLIGGSYENLPRIIDKCHSKILKKIVKDSKKPLLTTSEPAEIVNTEQETNMITESTTVQRCSSSNGNNIA